MKSILFIALTLIAIFSADLNGGLLYSEEEQSSYSLFPDTCGNMDNENILSDEDTAFFSSTHISAGSTSGFSCSQVSKTILAITSSVFQPPKDASL